MGNTLRVFGVSLTAMLLATILATPARAAESVSATITDLKITAATLDPRTGNALVTATVTCSETMQLDAYSVIYQGRGRSDHFAGVAGGISPIFCGATPTTFTVEDTPLYDSAKLIPTEAHVNVFVENRANRLVYRGEDRDMRLSVELR